MAQGYFEIRLRKEDGSSDDELMQKVIDWCKAHYDWFVQGFENGQLDLDSGLKSVTNNGIIESEVPDESLESGWIRDIFDTFKPFDMKVIQILAEGEYSEGPYSYNKWITLRNGDEAKLKVWACAWDWTDGACVGLESGPNGRLLEQSETLGQYYGEFINKVNGKISKPYVVIHRKKLSLMFDSFLLNKAGKKIGTLADFDHFDDDILNAIYDYCDEWDGSEDDKNLDNWEFKGFNTDDFWNDGKM